ncbi:MAG TPA: 7-carboxy-7-deazaguanine synthase QueE [Candidatus Baltobacteraceae bacterium]|jgi:organic radical activating enzyme|nr:7-carboxy-7-deazaguanine synthase QueE [Candidatus Baltobacteraceae bacterium]
MLALAEIFFSLQGEGTFTGSPAVFVRTAGCNLNCRFCDTDYSVRTFLPVERIVDRVRELSPQCPMVILTGGEPLIQTETPSLIEALRRDGRRVHIESNGTTAVTLPDDVWLTVSPKERLSPVMAARANEVKLIVDGRVPLEWLTEFPATTPIFLQPEGNKPANVALAVETAKTHADRLRLSLQTHKFIGIR